MPNIGVPELVLILIVVIIIFGVGRLGEVGGAVGRGIREFRKASQGLDEELKGEKSEKKDSETKTEKKEA